MSRWHENFQNHPFRATWNALKALLEQDNFVSGDNAQFKEIGRIQKVVKYVDTLIDQIDPELMPAPLLDTLNQHASGCVSELNAFKGSNNIGNLFNANTYIDSIISIFSQTPFILNGHQKGSLSKASLAYAEALDKHLEKLNVTVSSEIANVKNEMSGIRVKIEENQRALIVLNEQLQTVGQTIQQQTAEFNTQFQASEKARSDRFETIATRLQDNADEEQKKLSNKADNEFEKLSTKAGTALEILGKYLDDAGKVFNVVVNTLQAGAYSSYANEEKKTANYLRWSAIFLMILGVGFLVIPEISKFIKDVENYALDWRVVLGRIPFSLVLFVPAFYLARESSKHRGTEVINRRRELILSTIDPYLVLVDSEKAQQIKLEIAKGIFSEGNLPTSDSSTDETGNVIAQFANLMKQIKEK